jgi:hypothetical protein
MATERKARIDDAESAVDLPELRIVMNMFAATNNDDSEGEVQSFEKTRISCRPHFILIGRKT